MRTAKIFANGRSRAVRIPGGWLDGADEVELRREGDSVILAPIRPTLGELSDTFAGDPVLLERKKQTKTAPRKIGL